MTYEWRRLLRLTHVQSIYVLLEHTNTIKINSSSIKCILKHFTLPFNFSLFESFLQNLFEKIVIGIVIIYLSEK